MARQIEITCINRSDRPNAHERIINVGGIHGGIRWKFSQQDAISAIASGQWAFYVTRGETTVEITVAASREGDMYIKTVDDGEQPDILLSLPECPDLKTWTAVEN